MHIATDRPIWPQGYDRPAGEDPVPSTLDWDLWLGPAPVRPFKARYPLCWRGFTEFGSGALGDIAPHSVNVIFWALDLGAPSAVELVATSGMTREMYPDWTVLRFEWPRRGVHPPLSVYWYDGGKVPPREITGEGKGGMVWIGTKGSLPAGRGPFYGTMTQPYPRPEPRVDGPWPLLIRRQGCPQPPQELLPAVGREACQLPRDRVGDGRTAGRAPDGEIITAADLERAERISETCRLPNETERGQALIADRG